MSRHPAPLLSLLLLGASVGAATGRAAPACFSREPSDGPGALNPFRPPDPRATALNAEAKIFYRSGQWDEARRLYRQALAADPEFLAPRLNIACSLVRQERFAEAATEAAGLIDAAYVPWAREVGEATDMGALKAQPEMETVRAALAKSARRWSAGLTEDVLFVARQRAPLRIPQADGVFILGPHQELFAWSPSTNRYRQLTADDGRVLGLLQSHDRRYVVYLTAEKLVRQAGSDQPATLRGVVLHRLDLTSLASGEPIAIVGDVVRVELHAPSAGPFLLQVVGDKANGNFAVHPAGGALIPGPRAPARARTDRFHVLVLSSAGASGPRQVAIAGTACPAVARDVRTPTAAPAIEVETGAHQRSTLLATFGASVSGLPLP